MQHASTRYKKLYIVVVGNFFRVLKINTAAHSVTCSLRKILCFSIVRIRRKAKQE